MRKHRLVSYLLALVAGSLAIINVGHCVVNAATFVATQTATSEQETRISDVSQLVPGVSKQRDLAAGGEHRYQMMLAANQHVSFQILKQGITLALTLNDPTGKSIFNASLEAREQGLDVISLVTQTPGLYTLIIEPTFYKAPKGSYSLKADELREATEQDRRRFKAQQTIGEADQLFVQGTGESRQESLKKLYEALEIWRAVSDRAWEARTLQRIGVTLFWSNDYVAALERLNQALELKRAASDALGQAETLRFIGVVYSYKVENQKALEYFNQAMALQKDSNERWQLAFTFLELGKIYLRLGQSEQAIGYFNQALERLREVGDIKNEAGTLTSLSIFYLSQGDYQSALNNLLPALELFRATESLYEEATALNNLGLVYYNLGDPQKALDYYNKSLARFTEMKYLHGEATVLTHMGIIYSTLGDKQKALAQFKDALERTRKVPNPRGEYLNLHHIGKVYLQMGELPNALENLNQSLRLTQKLGEPYGEATVSTTIGKVYAAMGEFQKALEYLDRALPLRRAVKDRYGEALTLSDLASVERDRGELIKALAHSEEAIKIIESLRARVAGAELRISYLAVNQGYYELYIDLLMRLHERSPGTGYDVRALQASERARARGLLDSLIESRADIRQGVDRKLLERERSLGLQLNAKEERRFRLLSGKHTSEQAATADREVNALLDELKQVQAQIRSASPRYAALTQPQPLGLKEIQAQLDNETLLLVYSLGQKRSFLFAVTPTSVKSYVLPGRDVIEKLAEQVYIPLRSNTLEMSTTSITNSGVKERRLLSQQLLGPVAEQLSGKRLAIVADGKLQYVPFAALPAPGKGNRPMVAECEIVYLPSVSVLGQQRRELAGRIPAPKSISVIADPVYEANDPRFKTKTAKVGSVESLASKSSNTPAAVNTAGAKGVPNEGFARLTFSRAEADEIIKLAAPASYAAIFDFEASRTTLARTDLTQFRIIHFATHAMLNSENPELSGIVLSLYDKSGQPQDGFLRTHEIYNLKLGAELVVLSACQTALGKEVRGEGLIGLARGFMYAGAPRVLVSLWKVNDKATAELMRRFYSGMWRQNLRPAAALRAAQASMAQEPNSPWSAPYYWAGFVIQGEWRYDYEPRAASPRPD